MVRGSPALMAASSVVRTRRVLSAESRRRSSVSLRVRPAVESSAMAAAGGGPAFDGGEERRWLRAGQAAQFGGEGDVQGGSLGADRGDGLVDGGAVDLDQGGEDFLVGAEQSADRVDSALEPDGVAHRTEHRRLRRIWPNHRSLGRDGQREWCRSRHSYPA